MRILTVASAELISKPVSLVSMLSTESSRHTVSCYINSRLNVYVSELSVSRSLAVVTFGRVLCAKGLHYFVAESSDSLHCERKTIFMSLMFDARVSFRLGEVVRMIVFRRLGSLAFVE